MKTSRLLLLTGVLWGAVAIPTALAGDVQNCTQVTQAAIADPDSIPNNIAAQPAEDDEACATVTVQEDDFGDAPDPAYPVVYAQDGARHSQINNTLYLGSCVDKDQDGQPSGDAMGDNNAVGASTIGTCANGSDEDGVVFSAMQAGQQGATITVTANQSCKLNAWIDWAGNSSWGDAGDQVAKDMQLNAGANTLTLDVPSSAHAGATYARFRCSTAGGDGVTGAAADGEVEDYRVNIMAAVPKIDLKKYVQAKTGAPGYDENNEVGTLGNDAQDFPSGIVLPYGSDALYRIRVENTGAAKLGSVTVDDQIAGCDPLDKIYDSNPANAANVMDKGEVWVMECTLPALKQDIVNIAKVRGIPINDDGTETGQSPVMDVDPANVIIQQQNPAISLKKYVRLAGDTNTPGADAQDALHALLVNAGDDVTYRIEVRNTGSAVLGNVDVQDALEGCTLPPSPTVEVGDQDNLLEANEVWSYECIQANVTKAVYNLATVTAKPVHDDGTPTGQSPVTASDPANVTTSPLPAITLKTYVQDNTNPSLYDSTDDTTLGLDAQDITSAAFIPYDGTALYRITVTNTGNTWLDTVNMQPHLTNCANLTVIDQGDGDNSLKPAERWVYQCSLANVNENVSNTATVDARPVNPDGTPTNQSPVNASDPANITTEPAPKITLKTWVQDDNGAPVYDPADPLTLGQDAQDAATAAYIPYDGTALYRIVATNTGNTWLDNVVMNPNLANCANLTIIDQGDGDNAMRPGENWVYECTLSQVNENVGNTATVVAHPINPDGTPTNQSPVNASDPANITTEPAPKITLKTWVQDNNGSPAYDPADPLTLGQDAQDASTAAYIPYDETALYRIVVTNTGNTWLDNVVMEPNLANCANLTIIDKGDGDATLRPGEAWVYECTLDKVNENVSNTATVTAHPVNPDGTPTNQSPVNASDPANITTEPKPGILLKKYVQPADTAMLYDAADDTTLGLDAQDETGAAYIMYDASALYTITVTNTGNTWLKDITVDDKLEGCDATLIDNGDGDTYLRPLERWVYTCQIDHVKQPVSNLATVQAYAINPDLTPTNQAPVTSEDVANIRTHKGHSIGNYVWVDDGNGITANRNNGTADAGEKPVPDGVVLELNDASGNPVNLGNGVLTTVTSSGYYLFSALPPGQYQVCVAASNFADGASLAGYVVSTVNESDPNADKDQNNDGLAPVNGKVCSGILTLDDNEPVKEFPAASGQAGNDAAGSDDTASNLTVDFAFVPIEVGVGNRLWIDEGVSPATTNNGIYDNGEAPLANVLVEVYKQGQDPDVDMPVSTTLSDRFGCYSFEHLTAGTYFVHVPYYQTVLDSTLEIKPLYAYVSSKGNDGDTGIDDDKGENGVDQLATMELSGLMTSPFTLKAGQEPTGERQCGKTTPTLDDNSYDGTQDIGVLRYMQLGNLVWFDRNANGMQDSNEAGIADATAELFNADGTTPAIDIHGNPVAAVKTDAQGKYLFTSLAPGEYVVRVTPPQADYLVSPKSVADPNNDDNTDSNALAVDGQAYAQSGVIKLSYNDEPMHDGDLENPNSNLTLDFGFYIPVAVGDRVWLDHNGNGQQEAEDLNISGATVSLFAADGVTPVKDAEGNTVADQTTGSDGLYLFDKLLEGDYVVKVKAPSEVYLPTKGGADPDDDASNTDSNALPLVDGVSSSLPVTLQVRTEPMDDGDGAHPRNSSTNSSVDFGFIRPLAVGDFIWGDNNADGIQTDGETGLKGSQVSLITAAGTPVTDLKGETVAPVTVDETGAYHFEMLIEGDYIVRVTPPDGFIASKALQGGNITTDNNCAATPDGLFQTPTMSLRFNQQPETTVDGDNSDRDMTVDCGFFHPVGVGNYVWADLNGNGQQDSNEPGLAGVKVELLAADGKSPVTDINGQPVAAKPTGTDGKYGFDNLMPGDYVVQMTPPEGYRVTQGGADPDEEPSNMDSNCAAVGDTFQTKPVTLFGLSEPETELDGDDTSHNGTVDCGFFRTATLGGRLWVDMDADGKQTTGEPNLSDMQLTLTDASGQPVKDIFGEVVQPVKAAANGEYAFANLMAGKYIVTAQLPPAYKPTKGVADPNNDDDTDSNGYTEIDGYIASGVVDLSWDNEPVSEDGDPSTNLTIDFGFIPQVSIPTLSEWGLIIMSLMLMVAGVFWQRRRPMR
jgi:uncharacterized repeat protein (TIGR01451 family)